MTQNFADSQLKYVEKCKNYPKSGEKQWKKLTKFVKSDETSVQLGNFVQKGAIQRGKFLSWREKKLLKHFSWTLQKERKKLNSIGRLFLINSEPKAEVSKNCVYIQILYGLMFTKPVEKKRKLKPSFNRK